MKVKTMKLADLRQPEKNIRLHTPKQLKEFERSVKMFGQIRPAVIDENNIILCGNGLFETMKQMGYEEMECYQYTDLSENQKKKLMIADNKIYTLGIDNLDTLNEFLESLMGDLDIPGYDEEILKQMVADAEEVTEKISSYGTLDDEEIEEIKSKAQEPVKPINPAYTVSENGNTPVDTSQNSAGSFVNDQSRAQTGTPEEETTEVRKSVVCPHCGKTIWL